jgi:hypothetical protein
MALAVSPDGLVVAVEPLGEMLAQLEHRRKEHGIPPHLIRIAPFGLSDQAARVEFFQVTDGSQHELSGLKYRHFLEARLFFNALCYEIHDLIRIQYIRCRNVAWMRGLGLCCFSCRTFDQRLIFTAVRQSMERSGVRFEAGRIDGPSNERVGS